MSGKGQGSPGDLAPRGIVMLMPDTDEAATTLAAKLKTPLQIGRHLVRAFEAGFEAGVKPVDASIVETVLSRRIDDLEPQLTRHGYDVKALCDQFDAKPAEIRQLLRGGLSPQRQAGGAPGRTILRPSHRACAVSQRACAGNPRLSQTMCVETDAESRVGPHTLRVATVS